MLSLTFVFDWLGKVLFMSTPVAEFFADFFHLRLDLSDLLRPDLKHTDQHWTALLGPRGTLQGPEHFKPNRAYRQCI